MKHLLFGAALISGLAANAQSNRISLNFQSIAGGKDFFESFNSPHRSESRSLSILPTISFHRIIRGTTGIGLEIGYGRLRTVTEQRQLQTARLLYSRQETTADEFFISPGIFEVITSANERYRLIPYLNIPVGYRPRLITRSESKLTQEFTGEVISDGGMESAPQQQLRIGLQAGASGQVRIAGGLYAGISVGAGITYHRQKTKGDNVSTYRHGGGPIMQNTSSVPDNLLQSFGFGIQPQINLNYFF